MTLLAATPRLCILRARMPDYNAASAKNLVKLAELLPADLRSPQVGIVCGSGLGKLVESITECVIVPYSLLEGFGESTVLGHRSELAFGKVGDVPVVAMLGRFHAYEGYSLDTVVYPIRLMAALGIQDLIIVVIDDHIALPLLTGLNPLRGPLSRPTASRFVPLSDAYARPLRLAAFRAADALGLPRSALAEARMRGVVGMSTVPEVVAARDEGVRVLVLSLVTNMVAGVVPGTGGRSVREELDAEVPAGKALERSSTPTVSHEEVLEVGRLKAEVLRRLVERIIISPSTGAAGA
ncbi:nucleoside phosphorylase domain-containing protein [Russula brevipes]|nr:nucleoside phosphorylase domain-containing protein [Russula brevipes]